MLCIRTRVKPHKKNSYLSAGISILILFIKIYVQLFIYITNLLTTSKVKGAQEISNDPYQELTRFNALSLHGNFVLSRLLELISTSLTTDVHMQLLSLLGSFDELFKTYTNFNSQYLHLFLKS